MPKFPNAHIVLNSRDRRFPGSFGTYNNFSIANQGQNLVQGQLSDVALSEVLFPYDIPNIQEGTNIFSLDPSGTPITTILTIQVPTGFYTPAELVVQLNDEIDFSAAAAGYAVGDYPVVTYNESSNRFTFEAPTNVTYEDAWYLSSPYTFPVNYTGEKTLGKDILTVMGFVPFDPNEPGSSGGAIGVTNSGRQLCESGSAPMVYTQYIDICSPKLCQYQYVRDGSSTFQARRSDVICRLYIEDETSMYQSFDPSGNPIPTGTRPFVIHRQFKNQRVMRNTATNAVNDIDIQLYDDVGQPLTTAWLPRDFQITFHVYEKGDDVQAANVGYRY